MIARTMDRVDQNTDPRVNDEIRRRTEANIAFYSENPTLIPKRLRELDAEWDVERTLETMSSGISIAGIVMALLRGRKWLILPLTVQGFFMQHALQGWCPPLPLLRKIGVRTMEEIQCERNALLNLLEDMETDDQMVADDHHAEMMHGDQSEPETLPPEFGPPPAAMEE